MQPKIENKHRRLESGRIKKRYNPLQEAPFAFGRGLLAVWGTARRFTRAFPFGSHGENEDIFRYRVKNLCDLHCIIQNFINILTFL